MGSAWSQDLFLSSFCGSHGAVTFNVVDVVRVQILSLADNVEMVATVEIDAASVYWNCTSCSEQPCFSKFLGGFVEFSMILGAMGILLQP